MFKRPKNDNRYRWTNHAVYKMTQYGISESLVKRIIRYPERIEEGVIEEAVAAMKSTQSKKDGEVWVMYVIDSRSSGENMPNYLKRSGQKIVIITAWRYPGKSPKRNPVPAHILEEALEVLRY